jgi:hypothetical protein
LPWYERIPARIYLQLFGYSPEDGVRTFIQAILSKKLSSETGKSYLFGKRFDWDHLLSPQIDTNIQQSLWEKSEELTGVKFT